MSLDLPLLLTQLLVILAATRLGGHIVRGLGQPRVIGEMAAGIALGPSVFGFISPDAYAGLFPSDAGLVPLATLSQLGVILFMFVVGLRLDLSLLGGRMTSAIAISHSSIVAPFALGAALGPWLHPELAGPGVSVLPFALFLGVAMSITAFPVLARIVDERGLAGTRLGSMAIACAAVDDATAWCLLAAVVAVARTADALQPFLLTLGLTFAYAAGMLTVGRLALDRLAHRIGGYPGSIDLPLVGLTVILAVASALVTEYIGVHALFGAFLAGTIVPRRSGIATAVADRLEDTVGTALLPVFFAFTGLRTDIGLVTTSGLWMVFAAILAAAIAGKLGASAAAARLTGMSGAESLAIGLLMNTRGLMELVALNVGLEIGVIGSPLFAMMVLMALTTTAMTSPLVGAVLERSPVSDANGGRRSAVRS